MKNFFLISAVLLCLTQNSIEQNVVANIPSLKQPPPYYKSSQKTPYYCDKSLENITNPKISIGNRLYNVIDDIYSTFELINQETCLNFEKKDKLITDSIGINFIISADGKNVVTLSNDPNTPTNVSLQESVYRNTTSLTFYIGLALGLIPEVGRPDRDDDVTIDMSNVDKDFKQYYNLTKRDDVPYLKDTNFDFKSAMFFGSDFGLLKDKQSTYTVKLYKDYQYSSYVSKSFSHNDYKHMYYYYCDDPKKKNNCKYGGYPLPEDPNKCKCPHYLTGNDCGKFNLDLDQGFTVIRPRSVFPLVANDTEQCVSVNLMNEIVYLNVTSKNNKKVSIVVEDLTFGRTNCKIGRSYLEIFIREDKGAAGINLCKSSENIRLPTLSKEVFLVFKAHYENTSLSFSFKED